MRAAILRSSATNYQAWTAEGGTPYSGTSPPMPDAAFGVCLRFVFRFPYGLYGMGIFLAAIVLLVVAIMHMGAGGDGQYDKTRNLTYSHKGTYGTAGFLNPKEAGQVLDFVPDLRKHHGTILGEVDGRVVCIPEKTRFNGNLAVYGASGSKKTRAFCVNMILRCAARKSYLVICDAEVRIIRENQRVPARSGLHRPRVQLGHACVVRFVELPVRDRRAGS